MTSKMGPSAPTLSPSDVAVCSMMFLEFHRGGPFSFVVQPRFLAALKVGMEDGVH